MINQNKYQEEPQGILVDDIKCQFLTGKTSGNESKYLKLKITNCSAYVQLHTVSTLR